MGRGDILELINLLEGHSRQRISVSLKNKAGRQEKISCMLDTGCATTMLDIDLAHTYGEKLLETQAIGLGSTRYLAQAYKLEGFLLGNLELKNVFVLAAQFDIANELYYGMLLGLNVLNNLRYCVDRNENTISIQENIFSGIPDKNYPYMHWFRKNENNEKVYVKLQG